MLISERIYQYMKERGMNQLEFAKRTGISQSTVSDWRRKGTNPSADKIMIICEVLDFVTKYILFNDVIDYEEAIRPLSFDKKREPITS